MPRKLALMLVAGCVGLGLLTGFAVAQIAGGDDPKATPRVTATVTTSTSATPSPSASAGSTTKPPVKVTAPLSEANLLVAGDLTRLPLYDGSHPEAGPGPWSQVAMTDVPTLSCQADWLTALGASTKFTREFTTSPNEAGGGGLVRTAVLDFTSEGEAQQAFLTVEGWMDGCNEAVAEGYAATPIGAQTSVDVNGGIGARRNVTRPAPEICTECDATWFETDVVAKVKTRLVLVSHSEVGGPLSPDNQSRISTTVTRALQKLRVGL